MTAMFEQYKARTIRFDNWIKQDDWTVKVYTITQKEAFSSPLILQNATKQLPYWLQEIATSDLPVYKQAFLIFHEAREGVWILLNWWTGGEMIATKVYFSSFDQPEVISNSPYNTSALVCVWELEVFAHERTAWISHVLEHTNDPNFKAYEEDTL